MTLAIPKLADPPRRVPDAAFLQILRGNDFVAALLYSAPALLLIPGFVFGHSHGHDTFMRVSFGVMGGLLLLPALGVMATALSRTFKTARRMRRGIVTAGRVVSCHFDGDGARQDKPYQEFFASWPEFLAHSQMSRATGCVVKALVLFFAAPAAFTVIAVGIVLFRRAAAEWGAPDAPELLRIVSWQVGFLITVLVFLGAWRWRVMRTSDVIVAAERQGIDVQAIPDPYTLELLAAAAAERAKSHPPENPAPPQGQGVFIICKVEYSREGERFAAASRAEFCDRLSGDGVELLLVDPARPSEVELLAQLPAEVVISSGRWTCPVNPGTVIGTAIAVAVTGADIAFAIAGLVKLLA